MSETNDLEVKSSTAREHPAEKSRLMAAQGLLTRAIPFAALVVLILFFAATAPERFLTPGNGLTILQQTAVIAIAAFGMTFVIIAGSIDLSVGSVVALSGIVAASVAETYGAPVGVMAGLATGAAAGLFSGTVFAFLKVPSFVVTLGMLTAARGMTIAYTGSRPVAVVDSFEALGRVPGIFVVLLAALMGTAILLHFTSFGRYTVAVGGQEHVADLSGVPIRRTKALVFMLSGLMAGLGGVVLAARVGAATPQAATGFELTAIAAVVLGGTTLTGGVGSVFNTVVGALIITILLNGLVMHGVRPELQLIIQGLVLIGAVLISLDRRKIGIIK